MPECALHRPELPSQGTQLPPPLRAPPFAQACFLFPSSCRHFFLPTRPCPPQAPVVARWHHTLPYICSQTLNPLPSVFQKMCKINHHCMSFSKMPSCLLARVSLVRTVEAFAPVSFPISSTDKSS